MVLIVGVAQQCLHNLGHTGHQHQWCTNIGGGYMSSGGMSMRRSSIDDHGQAMACMLLCTTQLASPYKACKLCICALSARVYTPASWYECIWSHHLVCMCKMYAKMYAN